MDESELRKMIKEEFINNITNNLDSSLIFMYIQNLERKIEKLNNLIDKTTTLYLKELSEKGKVDDLACKMFNTLEGNIK